MCVSKTFENYSQNELHFNELCLFKPQLLGVVI